METTNSNELLGPDYSHQFDCALRIGKMRKFWALLTHRQAKVLDFSENVTHMKSWSFQGQQEVALNDIRGSENRKNDFDDKFYPLTKQTRYRWQSIARAFEQGINLPPVELIQVGNVYFVRDGHHRISVARAFGWKTITARVTGWNN